MTVGVVDEAGIREDDVRQATHTAKLILAEASVTTQWEVCPAVKRNGRLCPDCRAVARPDILVRIVSEPPADHQVRPGTLGLAMHGERMAGLVAFIYRDSVFRDATSSGCAVARLLAHVMAHEIGHLLGAPHSRWGLMLPTWDDATLRTMRDSILPFSWAARRSFEEKDRRRVRTRQ